MDQRHAIKDGRFISYKDIMNKKGISSSPPRTLEQAVEEKKKELKKELDEELQYEIRRERRRARKYKNAEPVFVDNSPNYQGSLKEGKTETVDMIYIDDDGEVKDMKNKNPPVSSNISHSTLKENSLLKDVFIIKNYDDYQKVMGSRKAIIMYGATYCNICSELKSLYKRIAARYGDVIKMSYTDIDDIGMSLNPLPQIVTYVDGKQRAMLQGGNIEKFRAIIKDLKELEL